MKTCKDEIEAEQTAKTICIHKLESAEGITLVDDDLLNDDSLWVKRKVSGTCSCGETPALEVTFMCSMLADIHLKGEELSAEGESEQYSSTIAICENCGE